MGEPINEEAWHWYDEHIGKNRCPIVDTWWQTETGGIMISNLAGISKGKPSYATLPLPGIIPLLVDEKGTPVPALMQEKMAFFMRVRRANRFRVISVSVFHGRLLSAQLMVIMKDAG